MKKLLEHEKVVLSNGSFDIEVGKSSFRRNVKDQSWLTLYENALPICVKFAEENCGIEQINQKSFTKQQCDVKYVWMYWCMEIYGFAVNIC